jgi:hypothetical protein
VLAFLIRQQTDLSDTSDLSESKRSVGKRFDYEHEHARGVDVPEATNDSRIQHPYLG